MFTCSKTCSSYDLDENVGLSIFVLVSPDHGVRLDDNGDPMVGNDLFSFLPNISSISFGTEPCFQLCWILIIFHHCLCFFACQALLNLQVVLRISSVLHLI
jgi:hypothetical protein